ncbi:MAG: cobalt ABC transporter ATP-binding protein [Chlamydiae bacterium]|nr:MAG: cobalt ABC transporter ATP-binding protein [Chlamydiota bacterium]
MLKKVIEINDLCYSYPDEKIALENINLDIFEGESVGIVGANGAGKTTLILHINGIIRSNNGNIKVIDMEMTDKNIRKIRSKVGLVFQNPEDQLFSPTVFEDVSFGPLNMKLSPDEVIKRTTDALEMVEMSGFENRSSHHLSEGEKKRISIATVLSMNPEILVLDEPTSNLDPKHRRELIHLLKKFNKTIIIVSHDLEAMLELCDRTVLMNKGEIVKDGKTRELMSDRKLMEDNYLECPLSLKN